MADCPRCKLALQPQKYEGVDVLFCSTCWGHWVEQDAMAQILTSEEYQFSEAETEAVQGAIFAGWTNDSSRAAHERLTAAPCPVCQKVMSTQPFEEECPVAVDVCPDHGMWLDTSEVKQIQVYFQNRHG